MNQGNTEKLSMEWVERIFVRLGDIYGKDWDRRISPILADVIKEQWATGLCGLSADEIKIGLHDCRNKKHEGIPSVVTFYHRAKGIPVKPVQTVQEPREYGKQHLNNIRSRIHYKRTS